MPPRLADHLTVIIPAFHEVASVADTVRSVLQQSTPPARVIVVDDCSSDATAEQARRAGAEVISPVANTGSEAGAQNLALALVMPVGELGRVPRGRSSAGRRHRVAVRFALAAVIAAATRP